MKTEKFRLVHVVDRALVKPSYVYWTGNLYWKIVNQLVD